MTATQKVAATAGGALAAMIPASADADIIYINGAPVSASAFDGQGATANWDVDGANGADFQMWVRSSNFFFSNYFSSNSFTISSNFYGIVNFATRSYSGAQLNGRGLVGTNTAGIGVFALGASTNIGPTLSGGYNWGQTDVLYRSAARFDSNFFSSQSSTNGFAGSAIGIDFNNFILGTNIMGFRFDVAGDLHYGWAEIEHFGSGLTITRWAYESDANTAIHAGSIPEPGSLALLGLGAAGVLGWRRRKKEQQG